MKILDEKQVKQALHPASPGKAGNTSDDFRKVLSEITSKNRESQADNPLKIDKLEQTDPRLDNTSALKRLNTTPFTASLDKNERSTVKKVERLLDVLESYSQALADPRKTLKEIAPLVTLLEQEQGSIAEGETGTTEEDVLNKLVTQARILTQVEVSRFNRGDYL
jgi:hypothetical protein